MNTIHDAFDQIDKINAELFDALVHGDAECVSTLVAMQCEWVSNFPKDQLTSEHRTKLLEISSQIQRQQALIGQALQVSQFFLSQLHRQPSYSALG
ncbi:hypothetical protein JI721_11285 [Alicyclobacillus cycloheptanicus]|uniref:Coat F domain-containing protein n=1 Tax=Alicyclobacillus cycloheptanicus TaxID=1457 RepID=A0ABT9XK21_9BACL|nr:hypothetical protein [Alicyclobacillus cycloheptanicus]MDQ0190664.1 hypothetical protein [Alicyclobacillus cycloheptanicus]WDM00318.1 hypothetical protein JI721_11285 [Alicyclobacillus cycloheptanicus]